MAGGTPRIPDAGVPVVDTGGVASEIWRRFWELSATFIASLSVAVNAVPGVNVFALAAQPSLGAGDAGYLGYVSDYGHWARWTGTIWQRLDDAPGILLDCAADPGVGYALCDGAATTLLVFGGATLTTAAFTTPNLAGAPVYKKPGAVYTGAAVAASGLTSTTGDHHHHLSFQSGPDQHASIFVDLSGIGSAFLVSADGHDHLVAGDTDNAGDHAHGPGTLDLAHLVVLPYVRR